MRNVCQLIWVVCVLVLQSCEGQHTGYLAFLEKQFAEHPDFQGDGFDYPVGKPNGAGYYVAQSFGESNAAFGGNRHLGEDWNGVNGGNSDLGDPIWAIGDGYVVFAGDHGPGWGNIVRLVHQVKTDSGRVFVESLYAHNDTNWVNKGDWVKRGQQIGTIGNAGGLYVAHLHFELRAIVRMEVGGGYAEGVTGFLDPREVIRECRP